MIISRFYSPPTLGYKKTNAEHVLQIDSYKPTFLSGWLSVTQE